MWIILSSFPPHPQRVIEKKSFLTIQTFCGIRWVHRFYWKIFLSILELQHILTVCLTLCSKRATCHCLPKVGWPVCQCCFLIWLRQSAKCCFQSVWMYAFSFICSSYTSVSNFFNYVSKNYLPALVYTILHIFFEMSAWIHHIC